MGNDLATESDFLAAVIASPADDAPRLMYADWLEEQGQVERAAFIRVQCRIARICEANRQGNPLPDADRLDEFISRESSLMYGVWELGWLDPVPREWLSDSVHNRGFVATVRCTLADWITHGPAIVRRHPVERVEVSDRAPLQGEGEDRWLWFLEGTTVGERAHYALQPELFRLLTGFANNWSVRRRVYSNQAAALDALSDACLALARAR